MTNFQHIENLMDRAIGFDKLFDTMHRLNSTPQASGYPPYNIIKDGDKYTVELAVAGFKRDEIEIELREDTLFIKGSKDKTEDKTQYVHKGIGTRSFQRSFTLSDDVLVRGADMSDGILYIALERVIPEEKKPRKIEIGHTVVDDKQLLTEEV